MIVWSSDTGIGINSETFCGAEKAISFPMQQHNALRRFLEIHLSCIHPNMLSVVWSDFFAHRGNIVRSGN
jgi:hypothetical protein